MTVAISMNNFPQSADFFAVINHKTIVGVYDTYNEAWANMPKGKEAFVCYSVAHAIAKAIREAENFSDFALELEDLCDPDFEFEGISLD